MSLRGKEMCRIWVGILIATNCGVALGYWDYSEPYMIMIEKMRSGETDYIYEKLEKNPEKWINIILFGAMQSGMRKLEAGECVEETDELQLLKLAAERLADYNESYSLKVLCEKVDWSDEFTLILLEEKIKLIIRIFDVLNQSRDLNEGLQNIQKLEKTNEVMNMFFFDMYASYLKGIIYSYRERFELALEAYSRLVYLSFKYHSPFFQTLGYSEKGRIIRVR